MGFTSVVFGYIATDPAFGSDNQAVLNRCDFDDWYPFTNIFTLKEGKYKSSMVSFAGCYKDLEEDWVEWVRRFEALLMSLFARYARVYLETEDRGVIKSIDYACRDAWDREVPPDRRRWRKWETREDGSIGEEQVLP